MVENAPLWTPSAERMASAPLTAFMALASERAGRPFASYAQLHRWSVEDRENFWDLLWDFCGVIGEKGGRLLADGDRMPGAQFFPDARLNFAENLLREAGQGDALVFWGEDKVKRRMSWDELRNQVSRLQQLFLSLGVKDGDRIAAMMPNMPETIAAMLPQRPSVRSGHPALPTSANRVCSTASARSSRSSLSRRTVTGTTASRTT